MEKIRIPFPEHLKELDFETGKEGDKVTLRKLFTAESLNIFDMTEVRAGDKGTTPEILDKNGLLPEYFLFGDNHPSFAFSYPYKIMGDRLAFVGYAQETPERYVARSFYLSNSHGVYKYLPEVMEDKNGNVRWFSKGHGELSVTAAHTIERALSYIGSMGDLVVTPDDSTKIFASTARNLMQDKEKATFVHAVSEVPRIYLEAKRFELERPEDLVIGEPKMPNFGKKVDEWSKATPLYGDITLEAFSSHDAKLLYSFASDTHGRSWVANIELIGPVNSMGVHQSHVYAKSLTTPANEYAEMSEGYGNFEMQTGNYVDMYKNYLSKIGIIQQYEEYKGAEEPGV